MKLTHKTERVLKHLVSRYFLKDGKPYQLTTGQAEIFYSLLNPALSWVWVSAPSRYGKTEVIAMALIYLAVFHDLKIPVVAGSEDKAKKIMEYVVTHLGDHPELYAGLLNLTLSDVEKLKVTVAKDTLRWAGGGWIYITSVDSRNISKEGEGVVGEGGDVVVLEEAGLIKEKNQFSKIVRMVEQNRGWGKLVMSGNCIENSIFEDGYNNDLYYKVRIPLAQAIEEGRYSPQFLEQQKLQTTSKDWKRYYEVLFPAANEFTYFKPKIYQILPAPLLYYGALDPALGESKNGSLVGIVVLGVDAGGQKYEVASIGEIMTPDEAMRVVFNLPYKFERFGIEAIQFQKYFFHEMEKKSKELKRYIPFVPIEQKRKKEERIESLEPDINTGQILFKGEGELWDELQDYPDTEKLDVIDTLEMANRLIANKMEFFFA